MAHTLFPTQSAAMMDDSAFEDDEDPCGATMTDGSTCERPADECQYH